MAAVYSEATVLVTTSEGKSLGQTSLQQLLAGLPTALCVQGDLCSVPRKGRGAPASRPVWGRVAACRHLLASPASPGPCVREELFYRWAVEKLPSAHS